MISIIIPTYNRATIIPNTLDSIICQEYKEWDCVVVDDFSTDNTEDVIKQYTAKDRRVHYLKNEHKKGAQGARNTGLYHSKSEWVIFFDSDNIMHPDFLQKIVAKTKDDVDIIQCFSNVIDIKTQKPKNTFSWISYGNIHDKLFYHQTYVDFNQAIIRTSKLIEIGGLDEDCPSMQEWDTHIRLSKIAKYTTIEEPLLDYFVGGKDAISTDTKREVNGRLFILRKYIDEWRKHGIGYKQFVKQIKACIARNNDIQFKKNAKKELRQIAWNVNVFYFIDCLKIKAKQISDRLFKK